MDCLPSRSLAYLSSIRRYKRGGGGYNCSFNLYEMGTISVKVGF